MSLNNTPTANRLHIALFGRRNSGKSSLINALTGQDTALVSDIPGTTTDSVSKAMELYGIGPCVIIDTPGFDDEGTLGEMRIERTLKAIERTDIALLFCEESELQVEKEWMQQRRQHLLYLQQFYLVNHNIFYQVILPLYIHHQYLVLVL
mgnify:CR=1 FL=1